MTLSTPELPPSILFLAQSLFILMYSPYPSSAGQPTSTGATLSGAPSKTTFSGDAAIDGDVSAVGRNNGYVPYAAN